MRGEEERERGERERKTIKQSNIEQLNNRSLILKSNVQMFMIRYLRTPELHTLKPIPRSPIINLGAKLIVLSFCIEYFTLTSGLRRRSIRRTPSGPEGSSGRHLFCATSNLGSFYIISREHS